MGRRTVLWLVVTYFCNSYSRRRPHLGLRSSGSGSRSSLSRPLAEFRLGSAQIISVLALVVQQSAAEAALPRVSSPAERTSLVVLGRRRRHVRMAEARRASLERVPPCRLRCPGPLSPALGGVQAARFESRTPSSNRVVPVLELPDVMLEDVHAVGLNVRGAFEIVGLLERHGVSWRKETERARAARTTSSRSAADNSSRATARRSKETQRGVYACREQEGPCAPRSSAPQSARASESTSVERSHGQRKESAARTQVLQSCRLCGSCRESSLAERGRESREGNSPSAKRRGRARQRRTRAGSDGRSPCARGEGDCASPRAGA